MIQHNWPSPVANRFAPVAAAAAAEANCGARFCRRDFGDRRTHERTRGLNQSLELSPFNGGARAHRITTPSTRFRAAGSADHAVLTNNLNCHSDADRPKAEHLHSDAPNALQKCSQNTRCPCAQSTHSSTDVREMCEVRFFSLGSYN